MKRTEEQAAPEDEAEDDGRSIAFWIAIAVVVTIPILIVATVIGSAVIGAFVLGIDDGGTQTPTVVWQGDYDDSSNTLTMAHEAGDALETETIEVTVDGQQADWSADSDRMVAGDEITVQGLDTAQTVRIVWYSGDGDSSTIGQYRVP